MSNPLDRFTLSSPSTPTAPRIICAQVGGPGSGKTEFALTGPGPIGLQSLDLGHEGVIEKFNGKKEIRVANYDWAPTKEDEQTEGFQLKAKLLRDKFIEDYIFLCQHCRTVIWDKETDVWNLFRYAEFGTPKGDKPRDFDKANQAMRKYVNWPKKLTVNACFIEDVKEEWVSQNAKSGGYKRAGFRELEGLVHVDLFHYREKGKFYTTVNKARGMGSALVQDKTFENLTLPMLGMMLFPDSEESDWE
jgi:hypothetical protein